MALGVTTSSNDESRKETGAKRCADCGAAISGRRDECLECRFMPSPWAAAVAVMGMLTLGVLLGSATSQIARSAGLTSIVLEVPSPKPAAEEPVEPSAPEADRQARAGAGVAGHRFQSPDRCPRDRRTAAGGDARTDPAPGTLRRRRNAAAGQARVLDRARRKRLRGSVRGELARSLPGTDAGRERASCCATITRRRKASSPTKSRCSAARGRPLETAAELPGATPISCRARSPRTGQVEGNGCAYPAETATLPGQLAEKELSWKAYVEGIGRRASPTCRHPARSRPGKRLPGDPGPGATLRLLPLDRATGPSARRATSASNSSRPTCKPPKTTPALSYIVPDACHAGGELPCEEGEPAGPLAAEEFLKRVVPAIEASPAYKEGGPDRDHLRRRPARPAPRPTPAPAAISPAYPNIPARSHAAEAAAGPVKPSGGGGRVGLLLLSPFVAPGTVDESGYFNHYSLLNSIEELFELEPLGYASEPVSPVSTPVSTTTKRRAEAPAAATAPAGCRRPTRARRLPRRTRGARCPTRRRSGRDPRASPRRR